MNIILIYFAIKYKGDWDKIFKALEEKEKVPISEMNKLEEELKTSDQKIITILDINYPNKLKEAYKPPFVLWLKGDEKLLSQKMISFTGNISNETSKEKITQFMPELTNRHTLVSASYKGVDVDVANQNGQGMVYILANGINKPYLNHTEKNIDLLISEYPPDQHLKKEHFANRNRLIAAMCESLILINSEKNGGINSLITNFLNLGKEIYCFVGGGSDDGNSELIKQGANLITSIKDICD
ncbi:DNA-processing protein DprA [Candidatus Mycoplasma mahonii]|uniref:DNA-processing protein DprA n=1 Tax=Candidatus Mycoplasma mahonii TaxID=3004105 RepID=UPI0026F098D8|nr:DNA-processing protein DprA [Candidatus Mycoplasma mahonii]WKX02545.1 DNA-processing protein DprA [Candidatus Mycoplasma mahonii]